jgi:hypothetical protein
MNLQPDYKKKIQKIGGPILFTGGYSCKRALTLYIRHGGAFSRPSQNLASQLYCFFWQKYGGNAQSVGGGDAAADCWFSC